MTSNKSKLLVQKIKQLRDDNVKNNSFTLFETVRKLESKPKKYLNAVLDKDKNNQASFNNVLKRWK